MSSMTEHSSIKDDMVIFYADDDQDDLETFTDVVGDLNNQVIVQTHDRGDKLLAALKNPPPSPYIIFLDLNMPRKNGFEVLEEIRQTSSLKHLPVVVVSTSNDQQTIARCRALGASFYITKPADYSELKRSVN